VSATSCAPPPIGAANESRIRKLLKDRNRSEAIFASFLGNSIGANNREMKFIKASLSIMSL
jgi:hypothetical protein